MNVEFQRRVDRLVGVPLCWVLSRLPRARDGAADAPPPSAILVILLSEMGSLVLAQPAFRALEKRYPDASVYVLAFEQNAEVVSLSGLVPAENVLTLRNGSLWELLRDAWAVRRKLGRLGVDTVIDCELFSRASAILSYASGARVRVGFERHTQEGLYRGRLVNRAVPYNPHQHIAEQFLSLAAAVDGDGAPIVKRAVGAELPSLRPFEAKTGELEAFRERLKADFPTSSVRPLVLVYPGGGLLPIRAWPLSSFEALSEGLIRAGFAIAVVGLASDRPLAAQIQRSLGAEHVLDLTGYTRSVRELMLLFHVAALLVTNDGGPGHFASLTPLRSITLFGPESPRLYGSLDPASVQLFADFSCSPCLTAYNHRHSPCDGDNQCLKSISADVVLAKSLEMLKRGG